MSTSVVIQNAVADFEKALAHLSDEFSRLQVGFASPALVEHLLVEAYGSTQPLKNLANISAPEPRSLQIQPWDRTILGAIEKAIQKSDLSLSPLNNGLVLILNIPQLTEERRRDLVKVVHKLAEEARIAIRNSRQTAHSKFKELAQAKEISEDEAKGAEKRLQEKVDESNEKIGEMSKAKEQAVMKV